MRKATIRMSSTSTQVNSTAAKKAARRSASSGRRSPQDRVADAHHLDHLAHVVDAHDVGAAQDAGGHRGRRAQQPLARPGRSSTLPMKLLREGPTSTGRSSAASSGSRRSTSRLWARVLGEADPGIHDRALARRRPPPRPAAAASPSSATTSPITSRVGGARRASPRSRRAGASAPPARRRSRHQRGPAPGSKRNPLTSLTRSAPASRAARATAGLGGVDRERGPRRAARRPSITGTTRRHLLVRVHARRRPAAWTRRPRPRCPRPSSNSARPWRDRGLGVGEAAAVGERVGGHVEHAHDPGALARGRTSAPRRVSG